MRLITGTGLAAGALVVAGGAPVAALTQSTAPAGPLGTASTATSEDHGSDTDEAEAPEVETDHTTTETSDDVGEGAASENGAPSALGQAHAAAMKIWARCVADAASGPKTLGQPMPPKTACGVKPLGPGQVGHQALQGALADHATDHTTGHTTGHTTRAGDPGRHSGGHRGGHGHRS